MVELSLDLGIAYSSLLCMALLPIYIGAHNSLKQKAIRETYKQHMNNTKLECISRLEDSEQDNDDSKILRPFDIFHVSHKTEHMTTKDAYMFPIIGSGVLFGLYMVFKLFRQDLINLLLSSYFLIFGIIALARTLRPIFVMLFPGLAREGPAQSSLRIWGVKEEIRYDGVDIISFVFSIIVGAWYMSHKHWIANNVLGLAFSIQGISLLSLGSYKVGCILLSGLFFYDIFWVFGTEVMVTVAKSFDAPVKLLFPKSLFAESLQFSMLGLGDIVIPGIFIALLLRFDAKHSHRAKRIFKKTYFKTAFVAYTLGLATTIIVMHTFQAAQPALLYLVPFCIGASLITALANSQIALLLSYTEEPPAKSEGEEKKLEEEAKQK